MGYLLPCIGEGSIRYCKILIHEFGQAEENVGDDALLGIYAEILAIAFPGMVQMLDFPKARDEGQF